MVSELISATGLLHGGERTQHLLGFHSEERPVGLQVFGEDCAALVAAAQEVQRRGADFVDLNLGCPVPKVVKKGGGAALCRDVPTLGRILRAMVAAVQIPVTIKIRTGWDQEHLNAQEVIQVAADAGVQWVAVHGRTRAQGYSGQADWHKIAELKSRSPLPIIGNGDLTTAERAWHRWRQSGVDAVMIGRAALKNPFIFAQAAALYRQDVCGLEPVTEAWGAQIFAVLRELGKLLGQNFNGPLVHLHLKKFVAWYGTGLPGCHEFRSRIFSSTSEGQLWDLATEFFLQTGNPQREAQEQEHNFLMGGHG